MTETVDAMLNKIISELQAGRIPIAVAAGVFERKYLDAALQTCKGNVTLAARLLGIHRNTVHGRLSKLRDGGGRRTCESCGSRNAKKNKGGDLCLDASECRRRRMARNGGRR